MKHVLPTHVDLKEGRRVVNNKGNNNKTSYKEMKLRRDRKRDKQRETPANTKKMPDADVLLATSCTCPSFPKLHEKPPPALRTVGPSELLALRNQIRAMAGNLVEMGMVHFEKEKEALWLEAATYYSSYDEALAMLPMFFSQLQWVIQEESLAMAGAWAKVPLADIDKSNFFRQIRLRVNQAVKCEILREGTQSWKDWRLVSQELSNYSRQLWAKDYTDKAILWLAERAAGVENDDKEDEDENNCELYKCHFIRQKRELVSKRLKEKLVRSRDRSVEDSETTVEEAKLKAETEEKKTSKAAALEAAEKKPAEEEEKKKAAGLCPESCAAYCQATAESRTQAEQLLAADFDRVGIRNSHREKEMSRAEGLERAEEKQRKKKQQQKPNSSIRRALALERVKREEETEAAKAKQQQEREAAEVKQLQEEEELKRRKDAKKMERRMKKKEGRAFRKEDAARWEQREEWERRERDGELDNCQREHCDKKASIVCRGCYNTALCISNPRCAMIHSQKECSMYFVHDADEVD